MLIHSKRISNRYPRSQYRLSQEIGTEVERERSYSRKIAQLKRNTYKLDFLCPNMTLSYYVPEWERSSHWLTIWLMMLMSEWKRERKDKKVEKGDGTSATIKKERNDDRGCFSHGITSTQFRRLRIILSFGEIKEQDRVKKKKNTPNRELLIMGRECSHENKWRKCS